MQIVQLTDHQQTVFSSVINDIESFNSFGQCFVGSLTGPAGCGKTVLTTEFINYFLSSTNYNITCTTPTHKSLDVLTKMLGQTRRNTRVKTSTIHSYLGLKLEYDEDKVRLAADNIIKQGIDKTNVLIIDESSMVSDELYKFIQNKIKSSKLKIVLFVGDKIQLLPVDGLQNPVYNKVKQYELTEVVRQAEKSPILRYATSIRKEIENKTFDKNVLFSVQECAEIVVYNDEVQILKDFCLNKNQDKVLAAFTNQKTDYYNRFVRSYEFRDLPFIPDLMEGEQIVMQNSYDLVKNGEQVLVTRLDREYDTELDLYYWSFKPNDYDFNIKVICADSQSAFNQKLKEISDKAKLLKRDKFFLECSNMWKYFWDVKNKYAEIKHCYGSTIHKLQGSTYSEIYVNLQETLQVCRDEETLFRLIYVAVTRAKDKLKIYK